jgi:hypothetical protein
MAGTSAAKAAFWRFSTGTGTESINLSWEPPGGKGRTDGGRGQGHGGKGNNGGDEELHFGEMESRNGQEMKDVGGDVGRRRAIQISD